MGSKRVLLLNGLGKEVLQQAKGAKRFVDLFAGTGAVAAHVAERTAIEVLAFDLQQYSVVLTAAVISRTHEVAADIGATWIDEARNAIDFVERPKSKGLKVSDVLAARRLCSSAPGGQVWQSYGGHYFSPAQAAAIDALSDALPAHEPERTVLLAALIRTAARCAAAPGHTAQPFQPTLTSIEHIKSSWRKDPLAIAGEVVQELAPRRALVNGNAEVADASDVVQRFDGNDVVFLDPPYSNAQYSRYYHVLETIARGGCGVVDGAGRYPPFEERPQSLFSKKSSALATLVSMLETLGRNGCTTILTFPQYPASNGVVGEDLIPTCRQWFNVDVRAVSSRFSTLGGNNALRASRRRSSELVLTMHPKKPSRARKSSRPERESLESSAR